ncbi:hypothetical protein [Mesobacillus selenatarsenatis]|uniref:Uncharacterized protein n=1 Tax=Mesobacillus selenatarsenatis (strain DSM 18680 / JCM 14380 / FERM P-15431 / SF-1) TaxID=1321606 RepID=A0A0A8X7B2_MESS1|nr:hypothetical protein [Mesobacillus selenatarsenatis]GAM15845.1 hypothetical protein SAMD00020551_4004 [Mesobacillus selenatarsenatis SF-1]
MPHFNLLQQFPDDCPSGPVIIGNYQLSLFEVERFGAGYRWIYLIEGLEGAQDLSDWVLEIDGDCFPVEQCFTSDLFTGEVTQEILDSLEPYDDCPPGPEPAPRECPEDSPCSALETVVGFKFDDLPDGLSEGISQLFAFIINQPPSFETGCAALTSAGETFCGEICVPSCIVCPDACECPEEDIDTFDCPATVPTTCFTIPAEVATEDVLFGFCIVDEDVVAPTETCQAPAEVFVCGQSLICCCEVFPWTRTVTLDIQFNVPKTADCQTTELYECCNDTIVVTQTCFTCNIDDNPFPEGELTCEDIDITINSVTVNDAGTSAVINYTVELPDCVVPEEEPAVLGAPSTNCPPPAPTTPTRNTQTRNTPAVNRSLRRKR